MRFAYADLQSNRIVDELSMGIAGEHLVCADLLLRGYRAFRTEQVCPYDVAADIGGRLIRFQVKTTLCARPFLQRGQGHITGYSFNVRHGKGALRGYPDEAFDILALIALDTRTIAYFPRTDVRQTMQFPTEGQKTVCKNLSDFPLEIALAGVL